MINSFDKMSLPLFYEVKEILDADLDMLDLEVNLIALLSNKTQDEVLNMDLDKFSSMTKELSFLSEGITPKTPEMKYRIDGMTLKVQINPDDMTVAQYVDYNTYMQMEDGLERTLGLLSVFLIPKGKKYGEYDINEVKVRLRKMTIVDVTDLSAFFLEWFKELTKATHIYLTKKMEKMKAKETNPQVRKMMMEAVENLQRSGAMLP